MPPAPRAAPPGAPDYTLVTGENRGEMVRRLRGRPVALDVETVGTDPWRPDARLRMVQLSAGPGHAWIEPAPGPAVTEVLAAAPAILGHNVVFDLLWLDRFGLVRIEDVQERVVDTLHLAHLHDNRTRQPRRDPDEDEWDEAALLDEGPNEDPAPGHGLKDLAAHHLGPDADAAARRLWAARQLPSGRTAQFAAAWAAIPDTDPLLLAYAAADVDLVWRLVPHLAPRPGERALVELEREVAAIAARMTRRGFLVDPAQVRRAAAWCDAELARTLPLLRARGVTCLEATGRGRDQAVAALEAEGAPLTRRTPSGAFSLDREVLDGLVRSGYPTADWLRRARRAARFRRDYVDKMSANRGVDGRLRPDIRTLGARTGRWAVGGALPIQQLPGKAGLRECLVAGPGRALVAYDYSGIEFVTLAALTRDPGMLAVVNEGRDPHLAAAEVIWPGTAALPPGDERKRRRDQAKQFTHGLGYGMGPATLAARSGLSLTEARRARDRLRRSWPGASRQMDAAKRAYWRGEPFLESPFGRRYRIPTRDGRPVEHQALNNLNQGTARDLMMRDLVTLARAGLEPWLTVHDEIIVECDEGDAAEVARSMEQGMAHRRHPVLDVPIRVEGGVLGRAWTKR